MKIESLNSAYKHLTNKQQQQIDVATEKINVAMLKSLDYGEEILVSENVVLYHYCEDEIITLNIENEWIEVFQIMYDTDTNKIVIEIL
tara:strand:- start:434 stop:697 length:264 start_codon:yes stop_codon:yes gene_type:complete